MIRIRYKKIRNLFGLRRALQSAIELEHSTIPPYLTAFYTLKGETNQPIANILREVAIEEMIHMSLAANILNAIGGRPAINKERFIPEYPGPLPMGIGTEEDGDKLIVPLEKFSIELVRDVFLRIEEPENPIEFPDPDNDDDLPVDMEDSKTIGEFYMDILRKLKRFEKFANRRGKTIFTGDPSEQVTRIFGPGEISKVTDLASAEKAINTIIEQGEGTTSSPLDGGDGLAHYYSFAAIVEGRRLIEDTGVAEGFSYSGEVVAFDPAGVINMDPNPSLAKYQNDPEAFNRLKLFNYAYSSLLNALHITFNGKPEFIDEAIALMYSLRLRAQDLLNTPLQGQEGVVAGPSYEYVTDKDLVFMKANEPA